jgi:hypothetical protein
MSADTCGKKAVPPLTAGIPAGISNKHTIRKLFPKGGKDFLLAFFFEHLKYRRVRKKSSLRRKPESR